MGDTYRFEIPSYQRPYSWTTREARELLDDVIEAMEDDQENYFLGSFVLVKHPNAKHAEVVDGQQRLTTLTILLAALRDLSDTDEVRNYLDQFISVGRDPIGKNSSGEPILKVRDKPGERLAFERVVQKIGATSQEGKRNAGEAESVRHYIRNAALYRCALSEMSEDKRRDLIAFLRGRCLVVVVEVPTVTTARRIFQVLNARGLDLHPTDILKARLLDKIDPAQTEDYAKAWERHEEDIGRAAFAQLFAHIRMIYVRKKPKTALEDDFENGVPAFVAAPVTFMNDILTPIVDVYVACREDIIARERFGEEAAVLLRALWRVDNSDWLPPVLSYQLKFGDKGDFTAFLRKFERLTAYLFINRERVNERMNRSAGVLRAIAQAHSHEELMKDPALDISATEVKSFRAALDGDLYLSVRVRMAVLLRLDEAMADCAVTYHGKETIEHVLPQEPSSTWQKAFNKDERDKWTHHVANLVLLSRSKKSQANNRAFSDKKGKTKYVLTQDVLNEIDWTPEVLERRRKKLLKKFDAIWQLK
ncbi:DUF262 domain-containing protein [uncultured Cohaesibacter sp.]|uniref:DUF262 domain-containing protein n=1 Tax=uncultured Cohaesibacter sp. TaxID=1002546 RepID=UPI002AA7147D|nr:DUF262 domain-containing protein [uncultured Cohaesibacter sp.]